MYITSFICIFDVFSFVYACYAFSPLENMEGAVRWEAALPTLNLSAHIQCSLPENLDEYELNGCPYSAYEFMYLTLVPTAVPEVVFCRVCTLKNFDEKVTTKSSERLHINRSRQTFTAAGLLD